MERRLVQLRSRDGGGLCPQIDAESIPGGAIAGGKLAGGAVTEAKLSPAVAGSVSGSARAASLLKEALGDRRHFVDPFVKAGLVNIPFEDAEVKRILAAKYDTDGDGEISYAEAQAVPVDWNGWPYLDFAGNTKIRKFRELRFFDKIGKIGNTMDAAKAFNGCAGLREVELPQGITMVGNSTFGGCVSLESVDIPASVTAIGAYAFQGCAALRDVTTHDGLESIGGYAFRNDTALSLTSLPETVTSIGGAAFYGCGKLALTSLPDGLTELKGGAFRNTAVSLTELPGGLKGMLDAGTFANTQVALTSLPEGITGIGKECFWNCARLALKELPAGVTEIGVRAFKDCPLMTELVVDAPTPPTLGEEAFPSGITIYVPDASLEAYKAATNWQAYTIKAVSGRTATATTTTTETT